MSDAEQHFIEDRIVRKSARDVFAADVAQVKGDLSARSVTERAADTVKNEAIGIMAEGLEIAAANKLVTASVVSALVLWLFRRPIISSVKELIGNHGVETDDGKVRLEGQQRLNTRD